MIRRVVVYILACVLFLACSTESDEAKLQQFVVTSVTALHEGDIDTYLQAVDYGSELDTLHEQLLRQMLSRYVDNVSRFGGLELVGGMPPCVCSACGPLQFQCGVCADV